MRVPSDLDFPKLLLIGLVAAIGLSLIVASSTSTGAFGAYNPSWEGTSDLRRTASEAGAEPTVITDTESYAETDPSATIAFVVSPDNEYDENDTVRVRRFVRSGGTLVVAGDFGPHTNPLLADLGVSARINGTPLRDERQYYSSPNVTVATGVSEHRFTEDVDRLTLNYGTALRPNNATVLVDSSAYAYLDTNRNGSLDEREQMGRYPVVALEQVGEGRVVVVSDPSVFTNAMLERPGNRKFVTSLTKHHESVLLDNSHAQSVPPLMAAVLFLRQSSLLAALVGVIGIAAVALGTRYSGAAGTTARSRRDGSDPTSPDPERLARAVHRRHPDWERASVERVVTGIINSREEEQSDDES